MKLNETTKKITAFVFTILMVTSVFAAFMTPILVKSSTAISETVTLTLNISNAQQFNTIESPNDTNQNVTWYVTDSAIEINDSITDIFTENVTEIITMAATSVANLNIAKTKNFYYCINSNKKRIWDRTFGGAGDDRARSIQHNN